MLKGISPLLVPDLLKVLCQMGHGDEIVLADAHFPGETCGRRTIWTGNSIVELLHAVLPVFELDSYVEAPVIMMAPVPGDQLDPDVETRYRTAIDRHAPLTPAIARIDRFAFYERAAGAFAVVMTSETAKYGNIILKKGVTPV